jgi:hypothetical protein
MTNISDRRIALRDFSKDLKTTENKLDQAGKKEAGKALEDIKNAGRELGNAADNLGEAANQILLGATANVVMSGGEFVKGTAHAGAGVVLAGAAGAGAIGEVSANVFGRALQFLGRALLGIGNEARAIADIGGRQYTTKDVAGDKFAKNWSEDLLKMSGEQFRLSANSYAESLNHALGAVGNVALGAVELGKMAKNTLDAAVETLKAAKNLGDAAVIEIAEKSVELAQVAMKVVDTAVKYAEQGTDAAGAALQAAGKGLIVAGNAVNSKRGTDTAVVASGG